ncbi:MAG: ABC transporter ATP-binding protein [candidate division WOR-3 bacterium]
MSHHIVEASGLEYTYPTGTQALRGVTFRTEHGESVGIIGANGAGKSTLLLHLNGCLLATRGSVRVCDLLVTRSTLPELRRSVGMVFQDPNDQLFMPTVQEDVAFGPQNMHLPSQEVQSRVKQALAAVGCTHLAARPPYELSGGEKRAVAIATVLAMAPDILVLDEPASGLDPRARRVLIKLLKGFSQTKIIAAHDLDMIYELCTRVVLLHEGRVLADGPAQEILADQGLLLRSGLELPLRLQGCPKCSGQSRSPDLHDPASGATRALTRPASNALAVKRSAS